MDIYLWDSYHDVFEGLGSFPVEYKIEFYSFVPVNINLEEFIRSESRKFLQGLIKKVANSNNSMLTVKKTCASSSCAFILWIEQGDQGITLQHAYHREYLTKSDKLNFFFQSLRLKNDLCGTLGVKIELSGYLLVDIYGCTYPLEFLTRLNNSGVDNIKCNT